MRATGPRCRTLMPAVSSLSTANAWATAGAGRSSHEPSLDDLKSRARASSPLQGGSGTIDQPAAGSRRPRAYRDGRNRQDTAAQVELHLIISS